MPTPYMNPHPFGTPPVPTVQHIGSVEGTGVVLPNGSALSRREIDAGRYYRDGRFVPVPPEAKEALAAHDRAVAKLWEGCNS